MLERFGIKARDRRNLLIVAAAIALTMAVLTDQRLSVRIITGVIGGVLAGAVFLVTTVVLRRVALQY